MVGALSVARMARITTDERAANTAAPAASAWPAPTPRWSEPSPSTSTTPAVATASASARWTVGRSPKARMLIAVAMTGNRL